MTQQEIRAWQEQTAIRLKPIVSYPREARVGERYLFTIDVQLADDSPWPYSEEEFEISFILETAPFFTHEPVGEHEPGLVLHRYGGTYGAAEYLLTASQKVVAPGKIKVTLLNGWGLFIAQLELECEVKEDAPVEARWTTRKAKLEQKLPSSPVPASLSTHEQRELIARQLSMVGWDVRDADTSFQGGAIARIIVPPGNIAFRGYPLAENDYLLIMDHEIVGFIKVSMEESQLTDEVDSVTFPYSIATRSNLKIIDFRIMSGLPRQDIPFVYHTTGYKTTFRNYLEPGIHNRNVYTFHQPSMLVTWLNVARRNPSDLLRTHLRSMPALEQGTSFDYQYEALQCIEKSLVEDHARTLVQLETGRGKTHIAMRSVYRLLAHANARHIFYVVDIGLAKQYAFDAFKNYIIGGPTLFEQTSFTDQYGVEIIKDEKLDPSVHVYIGTLEDLYTLYASGPEGQRLPAPIGNNASIGTTSSLKDYCVDLPIEYFDVIILAESEHIDYQSWQPMLDYFDTFYIGIASNVSDEVLRFFNDHLVYPPETANEKVQDKQDAVLSTTRQKQFATSIRKVRNLLNRDAGLYGDTDLLTQIIWLLLLKYLDDFEMTQAELLGDEYTPIIELGYRWRDWAIVDNQAYQRRTGDELLFFVNNHLIPYLAHLDGTTSRDLRSIIGTVFRGIHNLVRSGYILREVIDNLNDINFNLSDDFRATSFFYEELLTSKTTAGEFYTPRPLIKFIIDRLQPQLGETLLDPACGTAGFLTEAYEHLIGQVRTTAQRLQLQEHLIGIEKRSIPYLLALMNMLLHGIEAPNLQESNALAINIRMLQEEDYVDIIATNPPFNGKEERSIAYNFSEDMRTTDANLLYMQIIMNTLKRPGGRCGIIMANGFLSKKGIASNIRHRLLTHFTLHTIVRLPPGVFSSYTAIPANILFFESTEYLNSLGRETSTQEVWYYEIPPPKGSSSYTRVKPIQYEAFHDCLLWWDHRVENEYAWKVPVETLLANDCNLDVKNPRRT